MRFTRHVRSVHVYACLLVSAAIDISTDWRRVTVSDLYMCTYACLLVSAVIDISTDSRRCHTSTFTVTAPIHVTTRTTTAAFTCCTSCHVYGLVLLDSHYKPIATSTRGRDPSTTSCVACSAADTIYSRSGKCPERPGDLDLSPFDLGTPTECQPWHGQPSSQFWSFCDFSLPSYGQHQTDDLTLLH